MNELLPNLIALIIILICIFYFVYGYLNPSLFKKLSDNINVGYIERSAPVIIEREVKSPVTVYKKQKPVVKTVYKQDNRKVKSLEKQIETLSKRIELLNKKQQQSKREQKKVNPIYNDCVDALVALGYKKNDAKQSVDQFFKNNKVDSIEQFIVDFFKKDKND